MLENLVTSSAQAGTLNCHRTAMSRRDTVTERQTETRPVARFLRDRRPANVWRGIASHHASQFLRSGTLDRYSDGGVRNASEVR